MRLFISAMSPFVQVARNVVSGRACSTKALYKVTHQPLATGRFKLSRLTSLVRMVCVFLAMFSGFRTQKSLALTGFI
jgi:hypothetical protein